MYEIIYFKNNTYKTRSKQYSKKKTIIKIQILKNKRFYQIKPKTSK